MNKLIYDSMTSAEKAIYDLLMEVNNKLDKIIYETEPAEKLDV